jgi:hypothetical protein
MTSRRKAVSWTRREPAEWDICQRFALLSMPFCGDVMGALCLAEWF